MRTGTLLGRPTEQSFNPGGGGGGQWDNLAKIMNRGIAFLPYVQSLFTYSLYPIEGLNFSSTSPASSPEPNILLHSSLPIFHVFESILFLFQYIHVAPLADINTYFPSIFLYVFYHYIFNMLESLNYYFWILVYFFSAYKL
jgi:hypothetical protein